MIILEQNYINKTKWPRGSWDNEPDKVHFIDEETNMDCLIVRVEGSGHLCGYVAVDETHPAFKANYNRVQVDVYGGLTYGSICDEDGHICHVAQDGRPEHVFWLGFDHAHSGDLSPGYQGRFGLGGGEIYRDINYVRDGCQQLAKQLAEREPLREPYDWETE